MSPARPFEAAIFDFGGVLTTPLQDAMTRFAAEHGIEMSDLVRAALGAYAGHEDDLVTGFETGRVDEEQFSREFAARLTEYSGVTIAPENLVERLLQLELEEDMIRAVRTIKSSGYRTALLSNSWGTRLYPMELLRELFEVVVISGEVGLRKPDPQIFELTTDKLGLEPDRCIFVDDHPGHLKAALDAGMTTVLHRTPTETIAELEELLEIKLA